MSVGSQIKSSFVAGLLLITPLVVTLYVLDFLTRILLSSVTGIVRQTRLAQYTADIELLAQVITLCSVLVLIVLLGYVAKWSATRNVLGRFGRTVTLLPLVGTIYASVRQVSNALVDRSSRYDRAVLLEYPRDGMYMIGLVTGEVDPTVEDVAGESAYYVFIPNSPNPTAGRLLLVPDERIHEVDMSVGQGIRTIVTTGMGKTTEAELGEPVGRLE